jgi:cation transport ATPase
MMMLVAVGAGWSYSVVVTVTGGEVFYEATTVLTAFVLLGHWFEMRPRRSQRRDPHAAGAGAAAGDRAARRRTGRGVHRGGGGR